MIKNIKNRIKTIRWEKGGGELLGFAFVMPCIVLLICAMLSAMQISVCNQKLTYGAYSVCRATVICENTSYAEQRAEAVVKELYGNNMAGIKFVYNSTHDSSVPNLQHGQVYCVMEMVGTNALWQKGDMIKCTIYQQINPVMPFSSHRHSQSITMMIENGDAADSNTNVN